MDFSILSDMLHAEPPVSFREFVSGEDYCGNHDLFEYWYKKDEEVLPSCSELILDGSIGSGKTWYSNYKMAYKVYCLFMQGRPQKVLGLADETEIFVLYFSVSLKMAQKSGYQNLYNIFAGCKWFQKYHPIDTSKKSSIEFVNDHFHIDYASSESHQIGLTIWGFILDEANFRSGGVGTGVVSEYEEVTLLYRQLLDRLTSRFSMPDGSVNAFSILISSASYQSSFVEKRKEESKDLPSTHVITSVSYEVKPWKFSKETFEVFIGAGQMDACIVEDEDHKQRILNVVGLSGTGQEDKFFRKVPINLRTAFSSNIVLALQNHCGVPTNIKGAFMSNPKNLYQSFVGEDVIPPIFRSFKIQASTADNTEILDYFLPENVRFAERPHSIFLDLSVQHDTCAISCWRYDGKENGLDMHTRVFMLEIIPPEYPNQTKISKVQNFIIQLGKYLNVAAFASDNFQSQQLRQEILAEMRLPDTRISVDSSDVPHLHWLRALVEGRIREHKNDTLIREVSECVHDWSKHKVLRNKNSSDDVLQAEVGGFFLSDTYAKQSASVGDLYETTKVNLVGGQPINKVLKQLGYQSFR